MWTAQPVDLHGNNLSSLNSHIKKQRTKWTAAKRAYKHLVCSLSPPNSHFPQPPFQHRFVVQAQQMHLLFHKELWLTKMDRLLWRRVAQILILERMKLIRTGTCQAFLYPERKKARKVFFSSGGQTPCKQFAGGTGAHQILVVLLEVRVWTTQPVGLYGKNSSSLDRDIKTEKTRWQRTLTGTRCVLLSTKFQVEASDLLSEEKCCDPVRL